MYGVNIVAVLSFPTGMISNEIVANRGENVTLQCDTSTNSSTSAYWQIPSGQIYFNSDVQTFTITDIVASDGGYYTCAITNTTSYVYSTVKVYVTPYFTNQSLNVYTSDGMSENVTCIAEAFPSPEVYWIATFESNGETRNDSESTSDVAEQSILRFNPVMFGDEGVYVCIASNQYGNDSTSITVTSKLVYTVLP